MLSLFIVNFLAFLMFAHSSLFGQTSATANITYSIGAIDPITVSGDPAPLNITTASAGNQPTSVSDSSTTYAITTNANRIITGALSSNMPAGTLLSVHLQAPKGAQTAGDVPLTTIPSLLVSGISNTAEASLIITYTLDATIQAAPVTGASTIVTYTIGP